jgi:hypothetical protein
MSGAFIPGDSTFAGESRGAEGQNTVKGLKIKVEMDIDFPYTLNIKLLTVLRASVAQLEEHHLAKVAVVGSNPIARSIFLWCEVKTSP